MTPRPSHIHAKPVDASGHHVPLESCPCRPILAADMAEPSRVVYVHRHATWPRDDVPPGADALLWRSGEKVTR
jgi:hypothetical protein